MISTTHRTYFQALTKIFDDNENTKCLKFKIRLYSQVYQNKFDIDENFN